MKTHVPITHIMTSQVKTVEKSAEITDVERIMKKHHFRHIPVVENGEIIGIVSLTDLQRLSYNASFAEDNMDDDAVIVTMLSLDQIMVRNPFCVQKSATVGDVVEVLLRMDFHAVPVCDGKELIGIVTTTDLLKYFTGRL